MRGCALVQVPTTLMACVDSSIGGKTAVNVQHAHVTLKNIIGTFHPPSRVYIDIAAIAALPPRHFCNGMAEIIQCAIIASPPPVRLSLCLFPSPNPNAAHRPRPRHIHRHPRQSCNRG